jgi:hypothetical protein
MSQRPTQIVISGRTLRDPYFASVGDIRIYRNDDSAGRSNRRRQTGDAYSGYYLASIFDGYDWRKLQFNKLVPYESRSYDFARECRNVEYFLSCTIATWAGHIAQYDTSTRSFRLYSKEFIALD